MIWSLFAACNIDANAIVQYDAFSLSQYHCSSSFPSAVWSWNHSLLPVDMCWQWKFWYTCRTVAYLATGHSSARVEKCRESEWKRGGNTVALHDSINNQWKLYCSTLFLIDEIDVILGIRYNILCSIDSAIVHLWRISPNNQFELFILLSWNVFFYFSFFFCRAIYFGLQEYSVSIMFYENRRSTWNIFSQSITKNNNSNFFLHWRSLSPSYTSQILSWLYSISYLGL